MKLHYQIVGFGQPLVILHGLFGSSDNWRGLATQLAKHFQVITVDLRNHGKSPHSSEQNYQLMADDLAELFDRLTLKNTDIVGHSLGGKVAMAFAQYYQQHINKMIVVDMAPRQYIDEHSKIFKALLAVDFSECLTRRDVDAFLSNDIADKAVRQFLLTNLNTSNERLSWRLNISALFDNYSFLLQPVCENKTINIKSCFIRGGRSTYIKSEDEKLIKSTFPNSEIYTIEEAGHWVHADTPKPFLTKVTEFFDND